MEALRLSSRVTLRSSLELQACTSEAPCQLLARETGGCGQGPGHRPRLLRAVKVSSLVTFFKQRPLLPNPLPGISHAGHSPADLLGGPGTLGHPRGRDAAVPEAPETGAEGQSHLRRWKNGLCEERPSQPQGRRGWPWGGTAREGQPGDGRRRTSG